MAGSTSGPLTIREVSVEILNDRLHQIRDELDALKGLRGPIPFYDNPQWQVTTATADLPLGATTMNGTVLIENASATSQNLILYSHGLRFRFSGGSAF